MKPTFSDRLKALPPAIWESDTVKIRPIANDDDLWYATVECRLTPEQEAEDLVNPAGFSIGRAYLNPADNLPCLIYDKNSKPIGYIVLRTWFDQLHPGFSWSYYIDKDSQGKGYGKAAARLAIQILKAADPGIPIKLATESYNLKAQKLYESVGFVKSEEMDGDDFVFLYQSSNCDK